MATIKQKISPCLWFDTQAEDAAKFYTSVFKNSAIKQISRYGKAGQDVHGKEPGSVMVVAFEIEGLTFTALNGGPHFKFNEAVSFQVMCDSQDEIDYFWSKLSAGGQEGQCGWLKDKFGLSWQVVPSDLPQMLTGAEGASLDRMMAAIMEMKKFDLETLRRGRAPDRPEPAMSIVSTLRRKHMIATILIVIAVAVAAVLAYAASKPDTFMVGRSASIAAPAEKIFPMIDDLRAQSAWSPFEKDPNMKRTHSGAPRGKGAVYAWDGNRQVGAGRIAITDSVPSSKVVLLLDMVRPFKAHNTVEFTLDRIGAGTNVTWAHAGPPALHGESDGPVHGLRQDVRWSCSKKVSPSSRRWPRVSPRHRSRMIV